MEEVFYFKSPIGILEITTLNNKVIKLTISDVYKETKKTDFHIKTEEQLSGYFSGKRKKFNIEVELTGTDFQKQVWNELLKIPYAETKSYGEIANNIGHINAQRAVGSACNKNPMMLIVPCHRVISKNGDLSGFAFGTDVKKQLLELEKNYN